MPPAEFGGPGDMWSPETLLVASVANCFILTFRAVARASDFQWNELDCTVVGILNRVDRVTRFTEFQISVKLRLPAGADWHKAHRLAEKSESVCLITNSLQVQRHEKQNRDILTLPWQPAGSRLTAPCRRVHASGHECAGRPGASLRGRLRFRAEIRTELGHASRRTARGHRGV
ncbi:MAG: OsmC family protein [Xanthomonadales bacterium]|nr:OsmC family protein [Xanthomonadales bacterium]